MTQLFTPSSSSTDATGAPQGLAKFPSLQGRAVFVTGGGSGIGAAIVAAFAEQGARVAFVDVARNASEALAQHIADAGTATRVHRGKLGSSPEFGRDGIHGGAKRRKSLRCQLRSTEHTQGRLAFTNACTKQQLMI